MKTKLHLKISTKHEFATTTHFVKTSLELQQHFKNQVQQCILIYDERFQNDPFVQMMPNRWSLASGEVIKSLSVFSELIQQIHLRIERLSKQELCFIALGGGTVGDLVGFIASVYKRGSVLVQVPTTWLAAIDSSHGGKNALNLQSKNQLGTIHYPSKVFVVGEFLQQQPHELMISALGEVIKSAFLERRLFVHLSKLTFKGTDDLLQLLPDCIEIKNRFLKQDPFERNGKRFFLNLGHTIGHALEAQYQLPHGIAVLCGLEFMLRWSVHKKLISVNSAKKLLPATVKDILQSYFSQHDLSYERIIRSDEWVHRLSSDKKVATHQQVQEIFISKTQCKLLKVPLLSYIQERKRQTQEETGGSFLL